MNTEMTTTKDSIAQQSKRHSIENMYPLSPMQEGLLFHTLLSPSGGAYVPQIVLTFTSQSGHEMDGQRLKQAWQDAVSRHSILRTAFYWEQREQPFQIVYHQSVISWEKNLDRTRLAIAIRKKNSWPSSIFCWYVTAPSRLN